MIVSGLKYRNLVRNKAFSCSSDFSFSNVTGVAKFGFSGQNKTFEFNFVSGKMFDPENRYFSSYIPDQTFTISTNFSGAAYNYFLNNEAFVYSGAKQDFYVENFFVDSTGVNVDTSILISTSKPTLTLNYPNTFFTGQNITGYITTNSVSGLKIFTGSFDSSSFFYFTSLPTTQITSANSGLAIFKQNQNFVGEFNSTLNLETSAGNYSQNIFLTGIDAPFLNYVFNFNGLNNDGSPTDWANALSAYEEQTGILSEASTSLLYSYNTNYSNLEPSSLPISISLSYYSGITGSYGVVSSVNVTSGGNGYLSSPAVIFSGGFNNQKVSIFDTAAEKFIRANGLSFSLATGDPISFYTLSGTALPNPLKHNTTYYVKNTYYSTDPEIFTISTGRGGSLLDITNTGGGYFYYYNPNAVASGIAILGSSTSDFDQVNSVSITYNGSGYNNSPFIIFSGGTGIINNANPTLASGNANFVSYNKTFTGCFNLLTGINDNYLNFRTSNFINSSGYTKTSSFSDFNTVLGIKVTYLNTYDSNPLVSKLFISGINGNTAQQYITGVR